MSRGTYKRLAVAPSRPKFRRPAQSEPPPWETPTPVSERREKAQRRDQVQAEPGPALARRTRRPAEDLAPRPVRDLTDDQVQRYRREWVNGITRPHRLPWADPTLDLADCPCSCTRTVACALHQHELGGPRPFAP